MALRTQARPTLLLSLFLAASVIAVVVFGGLFATQRDWVAGVFAVFAVIGMVRLATLRLRLARHRANMQLLARAVGEQTPFAPATRPERAFVTGAGQVVGMRFRGGHLVIGQDVAAFVPTTGWRNIAVEFTIGLVAPRMRLSRIDLDADDTPALAGELAEQIQRHDGFLLDACWSWTRPGRALVRTGSAESLTIERSPPAEIVARWPSSPRPPAAEQRRMYVRILAIGGAVTGLFVAAGVVTWQLTADPEYLVAGLSYAGIIGGCVVTGVVLAAKQPRA
jgi:hypothetical protein